MILEGIKKKRKEYRKKQEKKEREINKTRTIKKNTLLLLLLRISAFAQPAPGSYAVKPSHFRA